MEDIGRQRNYMGFDIPMEVMDIKNVTPIDAVYLPTNFRRHDGYLEFLMSMRNMAQHIYIVSDNESATLAHGFLKIYLDQATLLSDGYHKHHLDILALGSGNNPSTTVTAKYDLPAKRNFAIQHAKINGHNEVMLLDDDIFIEMRDIYKAILLLRMNVDLVGFYVLSYPDVSTIDHVKRMVTRKPSNVSVGGNCLLFNVNKIFGFFPYVYNEDWLFIYVANHHLKTACAGYARQLPHEPWRDNNRVRFEQFGDIIARGIKRNFRSQLPPLSGTEGFWQSRLSEQIQEIEFLASQSDAMPDLKSTISYALHEISTFSAKDLVYFAQCYQTELEELKNEEL